MRWLNRLAGIGLALALLAGCARPVSEDKWAGIVAPGVLAKASLEYYWQVELPLEDDERVQRIWRLDENIYALTTANRLLATDAVRGLYKWSYPVAKPAQKVFGPCHADEVLLPEAGGIASIINPPDLAVVEPFKAVIVNSLSYALLFNRDTGKLMRKLDLSFPANSAGASDGTYLYVGSVKGWYYAVRLTEGLNQWTMATGDIISAAPKVFNRRLFVASTDGKLYAVQPEVRRNRRIWMQSTDAPLTAGFEVDARGCFVPSQDHNLYVYDVLTGTRMWFFRTQGPLRQAVQVGRRSVFQYAHGDCFYALDVATGRKRWELPEARKVLAVVEPHILVLTDDRRLLQVHESLGKVELALPMTGLDLFVPNAKKPVIYVASRDGKLACLRPVGAGKLTEEKLKD